MRCTACALHQYARTNALPPFGAKNPVFTFVGMAPGKQEDKLGKPFVGPSGQLLDSAVVSVLSRTFNIPRLELIKTLRTDWIRLVNVVSCYPPQNKLTIDHVQACSWRARRDLQNHPPACAFALGDWAIKGLWPEAPAQALSLPMSSLKGEVVPFPINSHIRVPVVLTWHPSFILRRGGSKSEEYQEWLFDIQKAAQLTTTWEDPVEKYQVQAEPVWHLLTDPADQRAWWEKVKTQGIGQVVALDWETSTVSPWEQDAKIFLVAIATDQETVVFPLHWPGFQPSPHTLEGLRWLLTEAPTQVVAHNLAFELRWWIKHIFQPQTDYQAVELAKQLLTRQHLHDTMLLDYIRKETRGKGLKAAVWRAFGVPDWSIDAKDILSFPLTAAAQYNAFDAYYTLKLFYYLMDELGNTNLLFPYQAVLIPATLAFTALSFRGIPIDPDRYDELVAKWKKEVDEKRKFIEVLAPGLNPNSPKQLQKFFFVDKGWDLVLDEGRTVRFAQPGETGKITTNEQALLLLHERYKDPLPKAILDFRHVSKIWTTYLRDLHKKFYSKTQDLLVLRPNFGLAFTDTGRTNCQDPNVQNFPKRQIKEVRDVVGVKQLEQVTGIPWRIVSCDQGQIEARLFALVSGDENFLAELIAGYDIHAYFAKLLFGVTTEKGGEEEQIEKIVYDHLRRRIKWKVLDKPDFKSLRSIAKNGFTFPCLYTAGIATMQAALSRNTGELAPDADLVFLARSVLFDRYPKIKQFIDEQLEFYRTHGYLESLFWRRRRAPVPYSARINFIIQSSASDITLCSGIQLCYYFPWILFVHDDNTFLLPEDELFNQRVDAIVKTMIALPWVYLQHAPQRLFKSWIPFTVEVETGKNWGSLEEYRVVDAVHDLNLSSVEDCLNLWDQVSQQLPELAVELEV